jgi:hypothetical protein
MAITKLKTQEPTWKGGRKSFTVLAVETHLPIYCRDWNEETENNYHLENEIIKCLWKPLRGGVFCRNLLKTSQDFSAY